MSLHIRECNGTWGCRDELRENSLLNDEIITVLWRCAEMRMIFVGIHEDWRRSCKRNSGVLKSPLPLTDESWESHFRRGRVLADWWRISRSRSRSIRCMDICMHACIVLCSRACRNIVNFVSSGVHPR